MNTYDKGDLIRCAGNFQTASVDVDPSTVTFKVKAPAGTVTTYVYLTDAQVVKDSVGDYHVDVSASEDGQWWYRFESTGTGQAAAENSFYVKSEVV
jgi:hypothetical protein